MNKLKIFKTDLATGEKTELEIEVEGKGFGLYALTNREVICVFNEVPTFTLPQKGIIYSLK